jgi:hypothetical protein
MTKTKIFLLVISFAYTINAQVDTLWTYFYDGTASSLDGTRDLLLDNSGNVYAAGNTASNGKDIILIKYSSNGDSLWSYIFSSGNFADDYFLSMEQSDSGFIYLACCAITIQRAFFIIKLSPDGNLIWTKQISDMIGESNNKQTKRLKVDANGNVYFTGTKDFNFLTVKLNPSGDTLWTKSYGNSGYTYDDASALTIDDEQNVYVTGKQMINGSYDFCTIKYNTNGEQQWAKNYDGPAHSTDYSYAITTDQIGNVYVVGSSFIDGASNTDFCIIKYNSVGDTLWVRNYDGSENLGDEAFLIYLDENNNLFVGGNIYAGNPNSSGSGTDFCVLQYSLSGDLERSFIYNGAGNDEDYLNDFTFDNSGNIYLTGESFTDNNSYRDICVAKFDSTANLKWQVTYSGCLGIDRGYAIAVNDYDEIFVAGEANYDFFIIKYKESATSVETNTIKPISGFYLFQNYPNPFNPSTTIRYTVPLDERRETKNIILKVYDVLGNEVATLVDEEKPTGSYDIEFNPASINHSTSSGVYFYQLKADNLIQTKKMILMK